MQTEFLGPIWIRPRRAAAQGGGRGRRRGGGRLMKRDLEAVLFATEAPLAMPRLRAIFPDVAAQQIRDALAELQADYDRAGFAFAVVEFGGGWQVATRPDYAPLGAAAARRPPPRPADQGGARGAGDHRLPPADHAAGHRGHPGRAEQRRARHPARAQPGHRRRPRRDRRPSDPLRHHPRIPEPPRPQGAVATAGAARGGDR